MFHALPKQRVANVSDIGMVMMKTTFKDDIIKFRFPLSLGLLELENEVAQRIKLKSRRLRLKYGDEDDDVMLIACDADLHNHRGFLATSGSNSPIKLIVQFQSAESSVGGKSSGSASGSALHRITDLLLMKTSLERPAVPFSGESRYLTSLWVFGNTEPWVDLDRSDSSLSRTTSFEPRAENIVPHHQEIKDKIRAALKLLTFREQHVLVQFWSPHVVGKHRLLTTVDQPFGLGVVDERLFLYRMDSECNPFLVDKDHEEEDRSPPARVYR